MSHLAKIELEIKDLKSLEKACTRMGFQFMRDQKTHAWYGQFVGDSPLPEGMKVEDLGKCDHAIRVPGCSYEVGVIKKGQNYGLVWDYWRSGGLTEKIGKDGGLLKQAYTIEKTKMEAIKKGYSVKERQTPKGIELRIQMR